MARGVPVDAHAAHELVLFIENESDLSPDGPRGQGRDVLLNALRKWKKGTYDSTLAVKLFGYLVETGAKRYAKEFGDGERAWSTMFPPATRQEAARQLEASFRNSAENGEYDRVDTRTVAASRGMHASSSGAVSRDKIQSALALVHYNGRKMEPVKDAIRSAGLNDDEIEILLNAIHFPEADRARLRAALPSAIPWRREARDVRSPTASSGRPASYGRVRENDDEEEEAEMWIDDPQNEAPWLAQNWHSSMGDPLYAIGSAGFPQPVSTVEGALSNAQKAEAYQWKEIERKYGKRGAQKLMAIDPESREARNLSNEKLEDLKATDEISRLVYALQEALDQGERISKDEGWKSHGKTR